MVMTFEQQCHRVHTFVTTQWHMNTHMHAAHILTHSPPNIHTVPSTHLFEGVPTVMTFERPQRPVYTFMTTQCIYGLERSRTLITFVLPPLVMDVHVFGQV